MACKKVKETENIAFFYRNSWYHRKKILLEDGSTKYGRIGGFKTVEEAEESYFKCLKEYEEQRRKFIVPSIDKEIMLKDYLIYWYENVFSQKVESTTAMSVSYAIYNLIIPSLPYDIKTRLTTTDYIDDVLKKINELGKTTANKARQVLNMVFQSVIDDNILTVNPVLQTKEYKRGNVDIKLLSKDEIKTFLSATCTSEVWYLEILLALFCGLRKGEIRGLKFEDFDIENATVTISRQLASNYELSKDEFKIKKMTFIEKDPKTENSFRTLKVPKIIIDELQRRKEIVDGYKVINKDTFIDNNYISCRPDGLPHSASSLNIFIKKQIKQKGLPEITVHGLRHIYATILIEQGVPIAKISALLGHSSVHTTFDFYLSVISEKEKITAFVNNTFAVAESEM